MPMQDAELRPSLKLMIVDDSNIIRRRIERSQQIDRLEVVGAASNGREAVELFRRTQPDVVTMDLTMPEMNGIDLAREIHAVRPEMPVILVSGHAPDFDGEKIKASGLSGLLEKPFSLPDLAKMVHRLV